MNDAQLIPLLERYAKEKTDALRDQLFEGYYPLAKAVARRFMGRGAELEDLQQVAAMALLKALERFEPERGYRFVTYAIPTITGDVRNFLRDKGGALRVPRDARQRLYHMRQAQMAFEAEHQREPSARELAERMRVSTDELLMLLDMKNQLDVVSLDAPVKESEEDAFSALLGGEDGGFERVEQRQWMTWVMSKLSDAEKKLVNLRFDRQLGQRETARLMGVSQMQISRMERRILSRLRAMEQGGVS